MIIIDYCCNDTVMMFYFSLNKFNMSMLLG